MNKIPYPSIIVVEGTSDEALLHSFLDVDVVTTNGSEVSRETIDYLKNAAATRSIVILTDPDSPGKRIRDLIAKASKDEVLLALSHLVPASSPTRGVLTGADLLSLGLAGCPGADERRKEVEARLHLGHGNAKTFLKRANAINLSIQDIQEAMK